MRLFFGWGRGKSSSVRRTVRPALEALEDRMVPTTFHVGPAVQADGLTTFATLQAAVNAAAKSPGVGNVIQIDLGSRPGGATITQDNVTIQGNPAVGAKALQDSGAVIDSLDLSGRRDVVANVALAHSITIGLTNHSAGEEVVAQSVFLSGAGVHQVSGGGGNKVVGNAFHGDPGGGTVVFLGTAGNNAPATGDTVANNTFTLTGSGTAIFVGNEAGVAITNNTVFGPGNGQAVVHGIVALDDTGDISGNVLNLGQDTGAGIVVQDQGLGDGQTVGMTLTGNVVTTGGKGTGVLLRHYGQNNTFDVAVQNSILSGNLVGVSIVGNGQNQATDYGRINLGGGVGLPSVGANDLTGYSGVNGNFALKASDQNQTPPNVVLSAQNNIFSSASNQTSAPSGTTFALMSATALQAMLDHGGNDQASSTGAADSAAQPPPKVVNGGAEAVAESLGASLLGHLPGSVDNGWFSYVQTAGMDGALVLSFVLSPDAFNRLTGGPANTANTAGTPATAAVQGPHTAAPMAQAVGGPT